MRKLLLTLACLFGFSSVVQADILRVAVAANFRPLAEELADAFSRETGHQVTVSFGSTGVLYNQISHGAPFDVFMSADSERPQMLAEQGRTVGEPKTYAYGRLAYWQPGSKDITYRDMLGWTGRVAIANPDTAPYGLAAQQVMEYFSDWHPGVVQGASILQALAVCCDRQCRGWLCGVSAAGSRWCYVRLFAAAG